MAPSDEKPTFGASIEPMTPRQQNTMNPGLDTPNTLSPVPSREYSPVYATEKTPPAYTSHLLSPEQCYRAASSSPPDHKSSLEIYETDLEAGSPSPSPVAARTTDAASHQTIRAPFLSPSANNSHYSLASRSKECSKWPSRQTLQEQAKADKEARRAEGLCGRCFAPMTAAWSRLDKRQRLWCQLLIALFIVAAAVGLGIGISKAVGGGVWSGKGSNTPIQNTR